MKTEKVKELDKQMDDLDRQKDKIENIKSFLEFNKRAHIITSVKAKAYADAAFIELSLNGAENYAVRESISVALKAHEERLIKNAERLTKNAEI